MTGDESKFTKLKKKALGSVTFGDNSKGQVIDIGSIGRNGVLFLENV